MLKGYYHIIAIGMTISLLIHWHQLYLLLLLYLVWLIYLYYFQHLPTLVLCVTIFISIVATFHLPTIQKLNRMADNVNREETEFIGTIKGPVEQTDKMIQFTLQPNDVKEKFQIIYFTNEGEFEYEGKINSIKTGSRCYVHGSLELPNQTTNPHQFDYRQYLLTKGITHQIFISSLNHLSCEGASFIHIFHSFRNHLIEQMTTKLNPHTFQWAKALVLGDKSDIDDDTIQLFQRWNLSHILAISGLHVGIIAALIYYIIVRFSLLTKEKAQWFILGFLPIYAILSGSAPSVWRASLMFVCFILLQKMKWKISYVDIISLLYILFILFNPLIFYHVGFQLSFLVTFGIILSRKWLAQTNNKMIQLLKISFISQMIILPLQINYFQAFQPLSILVNVFVVPYYSLFVIPLMFSLQMMIFFVSSNLINILEKVFYILNHYLFLILKFIDSHLYYPFIVGEMSIYYSIVYYCLIIFLMISFEKIEKRKTFYIAITICLFIMMLKFRPYLSNEGTVTMLDIGQGDAFVIELPYRKGVIMIDAGAMVQFDEGKTSKRVYEQIIKPYLHGKGIQKLDTIFVTHEHVDHYGSVSFLLEDFNVDNIILSNFYILEDDYADQWSNQGTKIVRTYFGDTITTNQHQFHVLSPEKDFNDANENSLVLYSSIGGMTWLFTGDAGEQAERIFLKQLDSLKVDVLKVGHHGSDTSTSEALLETIKPSYSLIPVGRNNRYNHPSNDVVQLLHDSGITIFRSDQHGAVQYHFRNDKGEFSHFIK